MFQHKWVFLEKEMENFSLANCHLWETHGPPVVHPSVVLVTLAIRINYLRTWKVIRYNNQIGA
jgi:hypothetical protein